MTITSLLTEHQSTLPLLSATHKLGCLQVSGPDSITFLQGQTSCDFNALTETQSLFGAICNVKGRVITNFYASYYDDKIVLIMSSDLLELTLTHLKKYAVFFKTEMIDVSESYDFHYLFSEENLIPNPDNLFATLTTQNGFAVQISDIKDGGSKTEEVTHSLLVTEKTLSVTSFIHSLSEELSKNGSDACVTNDDLNGLSIFNGQPLITKDTSEKFIPQMLNMQLTQGVNFKKGCYTGQEIVARMQYRGNLKKRAYLFSFLTVPSDSHSSNRPAHDSITKIENTLASLTKLQNKSGRDVAEVVASVCLFERTFVLAVTGDDDANKAIFVADQEVRKESLPYAIDTTS